MEKFSPVSLSISGKPVLIEEEVEVKSEPNTQIFLQNGGNVVKELFPIGVVVLTNFRLIVVVSDNGASGSHAAWGLHLSMVGEANDCANGFLRRSTRMKLLITQDSSQAPIEIGIKFISGHHIKDEFLSHTHRTLSRKSWEQVVAQKKEKEPAVFSTSNAGVGGLLRRQERELQSIDNISKEALVDLDALMKSARDVVTIVQRYAAHAAEKYAERDIVDGDRSETSTEIGEVNQMDAILQNIGIISPVTKFSAGRMYHTELARQLADLLLADNRMQKLGGFATLTDIYCLFNRARGTEMVSPNDFRMAAELVDTLRVGLKFKKYPSGVLVLHLESLTETVAAQRILNLCRDTQTGLSASEVATNFNVSITVAKELLLSAESSGAVCRDESIDGLYFYQNIFK